MQKVRTYLILPVYFLIVIGICFFINSCMWDSSKNMKQHEYIEYKNDGFSLKLLSNVVVKKETPVEDFNIYKFIYKENILLSAYVGNQPSFKTDAQGTVSKKSGFVNELPFQRVRVKERDGTLRTEILIKFSEDRDWPMFIHFWYVDLPPNLERITEDIIASVEQR